MRLLSAMVVALSVLATPAIAQISSTPLGLPKNPAGRNSVAFDTVNRIYLVVQSGSPLLGLFLDEQGVPIGAELNISLETPIGQDGPFIGWPSIAFGGPPDDPVFLVTYLAVEGSAHQKYGRLVRYRAGAAPEVSPRSPIVAVGDEWYASEKSMNLWYAQGGKFIVGTRVNAGDPFPQPQLHHFDLSGNVSGGQLLGDSLDFEGSPALACSPEGVCLATGFALGTPFAAEGGSYARLFDAATLQPLSGLFYLDDQSSRMEDQSVVYVDHAGHFLTAWWRAGHADVRIVATDGTLGPLDLDSSFGPGAGDLSLAYNAATRTTLLVSKWSPPPGNEGADLFALELGDDGRPLRPDNIVELAAWDGTWPAYNNSVAVNADGAQWLVASMQSVGGGAALVTGTAAPRGSDAGPDAGPDDAGSEAFDAGADGDRDATGGCACAMPRSSNAGRSYVAMLFALLASCLRRRWRQGR
jgi:hypothetical protein